ncbi:MAG TPA: hypothetical protein VKR59_10875 [Terriglobales bacterium]|nr:hypothetical protein [Terriglobales bacterium]
MASIVIDVPEPKKGSFNHTRPPGKLLQSQTLHLREALLKHLKDIADVLAIDPKTLKTEGAVSTYIQRATAILHTRAPNPSEKTVR